MSGSFPVANAAATGTERAENAGNLVIRALLDHIGIFDLSLEDERFLQATLNRLRRPLPLPDGYVEIEVPARPGG